MMNFGGKDPFLAILRQFLDKPPMFMENLPKKGPLFREFWAQEPTHMGGKYPYPKYVMLPPPLLPPPPRLWPSSGPLCDSYNQSAQMSHEISLIVTQDSFPFFMKGTLRVEGQEGSCNVTSKKKEKEEDKTTNWHCKERKTKKVHRYLCRHPFATVWQS